MKIFPLLVILLVLVMVGCETQSTVPIEDIDLTGDSYSRCSEDNGTTCVLVDNIPVEGNDTQ